MLHCTCLLGSEGKDKHLFGIEDGGDSYGHGALRHLVDIIVEETGIDHTCVVCQGLYPCAGIEG